MATEAGRYDFYSSDRTQTVVNNGVGRLWALPEVIQEDILAQAIERFENLSKMSFAYLGFNRLTAADMVHSRDYNYGSRLSDREILACLVMGNLDVYPLSAICAQNLKADGLDCGIWDGMFHQPGHYYRQTESRLLGAINPGDPKCLSQMWEGPFPILRVTQVREESESDINLKNMKNEDGVIIMWPNEAILFGYSPAIKIRDLNVSLETRSNWGRWAIAGAVNSVTVHNPFNGVLTAEATAFTRHPMVLSTQWKPFQMRFERTNTPLVRDEGQKLTFSSTTDLSLEDAAKDFQNHPERMLPKIAS